MKYQWLKLSECFALDDGAKHSISISIDYLKTIIMYKNGGLFIISTLMSWMSTLIISSQQFTDFLTDFWSLVGQNVELRDIAVAVTIEVCLIAFFWLFSAGDFGSGIVASLQENKRLENPLPVRVVIKSSKLWKSFWKFFGVITLTWLITCIAIICAILQSDILYWTCIWFLIGFGIMANGYEFYSIGENLARMDNGKKYPIFEFAFKVLDRISNKLLNKIDKHE